MADDFGPIYVGDTASPLAPQFLHKDGTAHDLSGATITMKMLLMGSTTTKTGAGTWTIDDATNGEAHYTYAAVDVDTPGNWELYIKITNASGPIHADPKILPILPVP
jgi:hypothetical protein